MGTRTWGRGMKLCQNFRLGIRKVFLSRGWLDTGTGSPQKWSQHQAFGQCSLTSWFASWGCAGPELGLWLIPVGPLQLRIFSDSFQMDKNIPEEKAISAVTRYNKLCVNTFYALSEFIQKDLSMENPDKMYPMPMAGTKQWANLCLKKKSNLPIWKLNYFFNEIVRSIEKFPRDGSNPAKQRSFKV